MDIVRAISESMEIPQEVIADIPTITIAGDMRVHVENYLSLIEYRKENIQLKYKGGVIEICGKGLEIGTIGEGNITAVGKIDAIRLI